jgi:hypothetical protein
VKEFARSFSSIHRYNHKEYYEASRKQRKNMSVPRTAGLRKIISNFATNGIFQGDTLLSTAFEPLWKCLLFLQAGGQLTQSGSSHCPKGPDISKCSFFGTCPL